MNNANSIRQIIDKLKTGSEGNVNLMRLCYVGKNYSKAQLIEDLEKILKEENIKNEMEKEACHN